jgi:hypothetical protein
LWPETKADWLPSDRQSSRFSAQERERQTLMRATVLGLLQTALLQTWADFRSQKLEMEEKQIAETKIRPEVFKKEVSTLIRKIPEDFFTTLTTTGFDASKSLREDMMKQMMFILQSTKKFADIKNEHSFWST